MKQLLETVSWQPLIGSLVTLSSLIATLLVSRANRWLRVLLERERQASERQIAELHERELRRSNETLQTLMRASAPAERPTLESLLQDEKTDFSLISSHEPSTSNWPARSGRTNPGIAPSRRSSKVIVQPTDWSDDDEKTEPAPISSYPPPEPRESDQ